jgi:phospholipid/cholesterol/gamma-HCH transport system substrate-binding protein
MASYLKEEIKAGVIIVVSFLILSGSVILIGGTQFFEKLDTYYVKVMNAAGIEEGAPVKLGGVRVGKVLKVNLPSSPGNPVTIVIGVKKGTALYRGTKASIAQVGFVGDLYLLLSLGKTTTGERYRVGDTIPSEEQIQFGVLMARLDTISQSVDGLLKDVHALFSDENRSEIKSILKNTNKAIVTGTSDMDKVATALRGTTAKLEKVLSEVESLVGDNKEEIGRLITRARESIEKAGKMIETIETTAKSVDRTMNTADRTIDEQSQNIANLLDNLNRTTDDLRDVLQEVKNKPWSVVYKERKGKEK